MSKSNAEDLLALICTQDLLGTEEVEPGGSRDDAGAEDPEFGNDVSDGDLEGAVLRIEGSASSKQGKTLPTAGAKQADNFYDDEFDISTQELRELVD